ncbi:MAG: AraC family transcriptional regulator [Eubacteriales bacterium]|nr:AraC family transcriptional regulator [Eubacteriales bacterium]
MDELGKRNGIEELDIAQAKSQVSEVIFQRQEWELPHNPYDQELREMDSIRRGDVEMLKQSLSEAYRGEIGQLARDPIRQAKNIAICVITLASRAAIEGGMLPEEAFSMVDGYILKIEDMDNSVKIQVMARQAEYQFAERVAEIHENTQKNELVERTKNYIFQNLHSEIIIGEIGRKIGVNTSYLSNLFHKTEGITIQQYIRREKIRLAENMLRYSEYDSKEIANYLSFCSQSYFGSVFKEHTGMSPVKYRNKYGRRKETK